MSLINKILKPESDKKDKTTTLVTTGDDTVSSSAKNVTANPVGKTAKHVDSEAYRVLEAPHITEKATFLGANNQYVFEVPVVATKSEVAKKIKNVYGVTPEKVNMIRVRGKKVRSGRRLGVRKSFKKAIVTLAPKDKIEIYEGV
jgi:large subunit ribosomal protein L23